MISQAFQDKLTEMRNAFRSVVDGIIANFYTRGEADTLLDKKVPRTEIVDRLNSAEPNKPLSANQGKVLKGLVDTIGNTLSSNDPSLDDLQKVVDYITANRSAIESLDVGDVGSLQSALDTKLDTTAQAADSAKLAGKTLAQVRSGTTQSDVGLEQVDNTSDANKPVSTSQQSALNDKVAIANVVNELTSTATTHPLSANQGKVLKGHIDTKLDTTAQAADSAKLAGKTLAQVRSGVTKANVGLGNADNTSDADKPVSTAQQSALNDKIDIASIVNSLASTSTTAPLSANQGKVLKGHIDNINALIQSDTGTLDTLQEVVDYIKLNRSELESLGISSIAGLQSALDGKAAAGHNHNTDYYTKTQANGRYLGKTAKAADASKLDGQDSTKFVKNNTDNTISGLTTFNHSDDVGVVARFENDQSQESTVRFISGGNSHVDIGAGNNSKLIIKTPHNNAVGVGITVEVDDVNFKYKGQVVHHAGNFDPSTKANSSGHYSGLRAGATTKADVGLSKVPNKSGSEANQASTIALRDSSGDIRARLFRSEYNNTNSSIGFIMTQVDTGSNNFIRPSTPTQVKSSLGLSNVRNVDTYSKGESNARYTLKKLAGSRSGHGRRPLGATHNESNVEFLSELSLNRYIESQIKDTSASGTVTLDLSQAAIFDLTLSGNTTLSLSNLPSLSNETLAVLVRVRQGSTARSLTWWSGITWLSSDGAPDAPKANKMIEYVFSYDGSTWIGRKGASN